MTPENIRNLTDEEVLHIADQSDDPMITRLMQVILNLETELAYKEEQLTEAELRIQSYD